MAPSRKKTPTPAAPAFDAQSFLETAGILKKIVEYRPLSVIFSQGDPSDSVLYIQKGAVRLSVLSHTGKEAIVATLGPGDFLGEGALTGQRVRIGTARAVSTTTALIVPKTRRRGTVRSRFVSNQIQRPTTGTTKLWAICTLGQKSSTTLF